MALLAEGEVETQALRRDVADGDGASVQHDGILDDGEAEARAAHVAAAPLVYAVEALEDAGQMLVGNADAVVLEGEMPAVLLLFGRHLDGGALAGVVDGVVHQVAEDAVEQGGVALHDDVWRQTVSDGHVALAHVEGSLLYDVGKHDRHVDALHRQQVGGIVHLVERRDVLQERRQPLGLRVGPDDELPAGVFIELRVVENGLGVAEDAGHGRLQLVGNVLGELASHAVLLLGLFAADALVHASGVAEQQVAEARHDDE